MASWIDIFSLLMTIAICGGGIFLGLRIWHSLSESMASTKDKLKTKGYHISADGVSVQTKKRMNREDYVDATQRGIMRAMGASSIGSANSSPNVPAASLADAYTDSIDEDKKRRSLLGRLRKKD